MWSIDLNRQHQALVQSDRPMSLSLASNNHEQRSHLVFCMTLVVHGVLI